VNIQDLRFILALRKELRSQTLRLIRDPELRERWGRGEETLQTMVTVDGFDGQGPHGLVVEIRVISPSEARWSMR